MIIAYRPEKAPEELPVNFVITNTTDKALCACLLVLLLAAMVGVVVRLCIHKP